MLFSCSGDDDNARDTVLVKWKFKANGVLYQWEGSWPFSATENYSATSGQSSYLGEPQNYPTISLNSPIISSGNREIMLSISFPNEATGTFNINNLVDGNSALLFINDDSYSTSQQLGQCQINLNISQIATAVGGLTKGTFSGTMKGFDNNFNVLTIQITEGSFESVRLL